MKQSLMLILNVLLLSSASYVAGAEFVVIGSDLTATSVSDDGRVVVGRTPRDDSEAYIWSRETGVRILGVLPGDTHGRALDASADGSVVMGWSGSGASSQLFLWIEDDGMVGLGTLPGFAGARPEGGISSDGSTVVGTSSTGYPVFGSSAFRWTQETGMISLLPPGASGSYGRGVSADGSVTLGAFYMEGDGQGAFIWDEENGFETLGPKPPSWTDVFPDDISADGRVVIGSDNQATRLFRWTRGKGIQPLPQLPGSWHSGHVNDLSADGSIIVGDYCSGGDCRAFVWDEQNGTRDLRNVLIDEHGFSDDDLPTLYIATGISGDGTTIVGSSPQYENRGGWAIYLDKPLVSFDIPGDYNNNGTVEQADLDLVLLHWGAGASAVPDTWTNDLPKGTIDQDELDGVLLNWGNTSTAIGAAHIPEPTALMLLLIGMGVLLAVHRTKQ